MNQPLKPTSTRRRLSPGRIALLYAAFAALWIVVSGALLKLSVDDPVVQGRIELGKGLLFVLATSVLLYFLLKQWRDPVPVPQAPFGVNLCPPLPRLARPWRFQCRPRRAVG